MVDVGDGSVDSCACTWLTDPTPSRPLSPSVLGNWVGIHRKPLALMRNLLETRRNSDISPDVSIINNIAEQELVRFMRCGFDVYGSVCVILNNPPVDR